MLAKADGFAPYVSSYESEAGKHVSLRVGLLLEAAATGLVLDNADNPVEGARVIAHYDARADPAGVSRKMTASSGSTGWSRTPPSGFRRLWAPAPPASSLSARGQGWCGGDVALRLP